MAYLLDSDVFIRAKNDHYGFDFCPGFWDWLVTANAAGTVHSVVAVYKELVGSEDDLAQWVKDHRSFFLPVITSDIPAVAAVNQWAVDSPDYEPAACTEFAKVADSYLIGQAKAGGHTVVTHERTGNGRQQIKIPNAACANGVKSISPFQMLRAEKVRLVLATSV